MSRSGVRFALRRGAVVVATVVLVVLLAGGTAHADPAGPTDYRSEILSIDPPTTAVSFEVIGGDSFIEMTAEPGVEVLVIGYRGEPYLRFSADGRVEENRNSPTTYQNEERYGADAPAFASADAEPDWVTVADDGTYAWHDHRAHWMQPIPPAGQGPGDRIVEQVIPIVLDDTEVGVTVVSVWQPEPSMLPAGFGALAGAASVGIAVWLARRSAGWGVALVPIAVAATVAGWWQFSSLPSETGPRLVWPLLPTLAAVAAIAALPLGRRAPFAALAAALIASSELVVWAFIKRDGLTAAIVPTAAPQWFERFVLVAAFVAGLGGIVLAVFNLFAASAGTRTQVATT